MSDFSFAMLEPMLPELFLAVAGMALLIIGVFRGNQATAFISWFTVGAFIVTALILTGINWNAASLFDGMFVMDRFAGFMKILVLGGLIASVALAVQPLYQDHMARFEYPVLVLFAGLGMMMMISAGDFLSLYVGLELQSLSLYVLAAIRRDHVKSAEAGVKYFVLGAMASGFLLFGISLIYGYSGTTNFAAVSGFLSGGDLALGPLVGMVFVLAGIAFKVSAVPFHMWTPDVYEGAPTPVTALFAIVPKVAAMALLARLLLEAFPGAQEHWMQMVWILSAASMALGAFAGIAQENIKRLMAYSSIGNMGYALIGLVVGTHGGVGSMIVYMTIYMAMSAGVFAIILCMRRNGQALQNISDLAGLSHNAPLMAYGLAILMFSMSGIPPMAGFFGKLMIFEAAVSSGFYVLAVFGVLTSVVAAYYYLRIIKVMFFDKAADKFDGESGFANRAVTIVSILFILGFVFRPSVLVESGVIAAMSLF